MYDIDVGLMHFAFSYYMLRGYQPLKAPMLVDKDIVELTLPEGKVAKEHLGKYYVGSAEQSFYQLLKDGLVPEGSYMMMTPCQRDEELDEHHLEIFLKLELVSVSANYVNLVKDAYDFYEHLEQDIEVKHCFDTQTCDLEIGGVEVGSFGSRIYGEHLVAFGTGLALPRFSQVRKET